MQTNTVAMVNVTSVTTGTEKQKDYYGFAIQKGNQEFLNLLNVFVLELRANGYIDQFLGKYLPIRAKVITRSYNISEDYYGGD